MDSLPDIKFVEKEVKVLDARGLVKNDIEYIRKYIQAVHWKPGITVEEMAYAQGQHDLLEFIETKVAGRRLT